MNINQIIKLANIFEKLSLDINNADIVSNQQEYKADHRDSYLDQANRSSFEVYLDPDQPYQYNDLLDDQSPTRENYDQELEYSQDKTDIPLVGQYNNSAGSIGVSPSVNVGGFLSE